MHSGSKTAVAGCLALSGASCAVDETPPEIEEASFVARDEVLLAFSEPLASVADVDPDRFRLGAAFVLDESTVYYDVGHHFPEGPPGVEGDADSRPRHGFNDFVEAWLDPDDASKLHLRLYDDVESYVCDALETASELGIPAAIHVHYDDNPLHGPRVRDEAGNCVEPIGPDWVREVFAYEAVGEYPDLDVRIELPCPLPAGDP